MHKQMLVKLRNNESLPDAVRDEYDLTDFNVFPIVFLNSWSVFRILY